MKCHWALQSRKIERRQSICNNTRDQKDISDLYSSHDTLPLTEKFPSQTVLETMKTQWICLLLLSLISLAPSFNLHGLSCLNNYINNITCVWNSSGIDPDVSCRLLGTRINYKEINFQSGCDLKPLESKVHSSQGCSFVFEKHAFASTERLPSIKVECNGSKVTEITEYDPKQYIKMHPPDVPVFINGTRAIFNAGDPLSEIIFNYDFQVELKRGEEEWSDAKTFTIRNHEPWMDIKMDEDGLHQIRVRVKSTYPPSVHWSDWSPTASWEAEYKVPPTFNQQDHMTFWLLLVGAVIALLAVLSLVIYKTCRNNRKNNIVPDPAKYFHTMNSVHDGNFQKWLSPLFAPEAFSTTQPSEDISPIEVFGHEAGCSTATPSTAAILWPSAPNSSSGDWSVQSSCFSNVGFFYSEYPNGLHIASCPVYFTYQGDKRSLSTTSSYERLENLGWPQTEPHSPDSGFGMDVTESGDQAEKDAEGKEENKVVLVDHHSSPLLILPLTRPTQAKPHHLPSVQRVPLQDPVITSATLPSADTLPVEVILRPSSMTVETPSSGYVTIKELENTYRNKSI
ncbi:hypothetical protein UPYG_G00093880 [Umbra pygmaea]|uniref:Interleukin-2 receptor subunit beta N-terminal domain-containing protein n=1 Tax=Umbra pygmaea TaxID=75934 RepID=A0ABD0XHD8_UMBPY